MFDRDSADVGVDLVFVEQFLGFPAADIGLRLVVFGDQLNLAAEDAARFVDPVDGHLQSDERGLADGRAGTGKRLNAADLIRGRRRHPEA